MKPMLKKIGHNLYSYPKELKRISQAKNLYENTPSGDYYSFNSFDYHRCIFVHIPKAAGVSVSTSLFGNYGGGHKTLKWYQSYFHPWTFQSYFKFTITRHPYDRLLSAYNFLKHGGMNEIDAEYSRKNLLDISSFDEFVLDWLDNSRMYSVLHFMPQCYFLRDKRGKINLDFIGRFENLEADFRHISAQLNVQAKLKKTNVAKRKVLVNHCDKNEKVMNRISQLYSEDFKNLGY